MGWSRMIARKRVQKLDYISDTAVASTHIELAHKINNLFLYDVLHNVKAHKVRFCLGRILRLGLVFLGCRLGRGEAEAQEDSPLAEAPSETVVQENVSQTEAGLEAAANRDILHRQVRLSRWAGGCLRFCRHGCFGCLLVFLMS